MAMSYHAGCLCTTSTCLGVVRGMRLSAYIRPEDGCFAVLFGMVATLHQWVIRQRFSVVFCGSRFRPNIHICRARRVAPGQPLLR